MSDTGPLWLFFGLVFGIVILPGIRPRHHGKPRRAAGAAHAAPAPVTR